MCMPLNFEKGPGKIAPLWLNNQFTTHAVEYLCSLALCLEVYGFERFQINGCIEKML